MTVLALTWPWAAVAMTVIAGLSAISAVATWQIFAIGRDQTSRRSR